VPDPTPLAKAELRQLDADFAQEINPDKWVEFQFNPESLKVSFANQIAQPSGAGDQKGPQGRQFVGAGTTKLSVQIWFDVNAPLSEKNQVDDVRKLTEKVAYFITPEETGGKFIPPAVRFVWGSFQFDGLMDSLDESLEFFSPEGRPLRAGMTLAMSQQKITKFTFRPAASPAGAGGGAGRAAPGTTPLTQAPAGSSLQGLADAQGLGANWKAIASANGIDNPRLLATGQLIDMSAGLDVSAGAGVSAGGDVTAGVAASATAGGSASVGFQSTRFPG
jgi:hypothetical protein